MYFKQKVVENRTFLLHNARHNSAIIYKYGVLEVSGDEN
jgi:hypothetical protein